MNLKHLAAAGIALLFSQAVTDGTRWWSHIEFLADDALEGAQRRQRRVREGRHLRRGQFKEIGLKPGGVGRLPPAGEVRVAPLVPEQSKLALVRDGAEEPLALGQDASLSARGELDGAARSADGLRRLRHCRFPEAKWDDLAGLDLHGKIAVYVNMTAPVDVPDNVKSHVSSGGERWAVLKKAGAIGIATFRRPPSA